MMRWAFFLIALLFAAPAEAQFTPPGFPQGVFANQNARDPQPSASYVGPGNVVSGATAWYGLRGYNAAYCGSKAINIRRASDNTTEDINVLSAASGCGLDTATAASFAGTDATASCSTSGLSTTMACTGASSTPHVNDPVSGTGISQPEYVVSVGTFTAGTGTVTLSTAQNIAVAETVTFQVALFVTEAYDQTGNGKNATQGTAASQPQLLLLCATSGTLPCLSFLGAQNFTASVTNSASGNSIAAVAQRTTGTAEAEIFSWFTGSGQELFFGSGATIGIFGTGNSVSGISFSNGTLYTIQSANPASGTAFLSANNTTNSGTGGAPTSNATLAIGSNALGARFLTGQINQGGLWNLVGFSTTQITNLCHNDNVYYSLGLSC